jgi:hypothetical protein
MTNFNVGFRYYIELNPIRKEKRYFIKTGRPRKTKVPHL